MNRFNPKACGNPAYLGGGARHALASEHRRGKAVAGRDEGLAGQRSRQSEQEHAHALGHDVRLRCFVLLVLLLMGGVLGRITCYGGSTSMVPRRADRGVEQSIGG